MPCRVSIAGAVALSLLPFPGSEQPLPVIDMHVHALAAHDQGPPPLAVCPGEPFPAWDPRRPWPEAFLAHLTRPPCADPVWSPHTDDALRDQTMAALRRRNVIGVLSGPPDRVGLWHRLAPGRIIPGLALPVGRGGPTVDELRALHAVQAVAVLAEVTNQYAGIEPGDPVMRPYFALAADADLPVGIHIGTGPPGAPHLAYPRYRARMHSALSLEEPLMAHPTLRVVVMHAGWPLLDDMLAVMWTHPQVHVEVGGIVWALPRAGFYDYLRRMVDAGFGKRIMFGSDQMVWPGVIEYGIRVIEEAPFLSAQQKRDILYENAARFLRFSPALIDRHYGR